MDNKIFLILGGGVLIYLWYQNQSASSCTAATWSAAGLPLPGDGTLTVANVTALAATAGLTAGQLMTLLSSGGTQIPAATATQLVACMTSLGIAAAALPTSSSTAGSTPAGVNASSVAGNTTTASGVTTNAGYQASPVTSLAGIYSAMVAAASKDANYIAGNGLMSPFQWNFYLGYVDPTAPVGMVWPPDPGTAGFADTTTPISAQAYWAVMSPYLQAKYGMSGLRGLGAVRSAYFDNRHGGWAA